METRYLDMWKYIFEGMLSEFQVTNQIKEEFHMFRAQLELICWCSLFVLYISLETEKKI